MDEPLKNNPTDQKTQKPAQDDEVVFPDENDTAPPITSLPPRRFSIFRLIVTLAVVLGIYLLGFYTSPTQLEFAKTEIKELIQISRQKLEPIKHKVVETIETKIGGKPKEPVKSKEPMPTVRPSETKHKRKIKYWRAPMNPNYISDKPGKSPMGMDLIPVYEGEEDTSQIEINPRVVQNIGVKTETLVNRKLTHPIRTVGILTYDERLVHHIHTKYGGWIEKLYVDFTGQEVKKGDLLLEIYSPELVSTQEEFVLALNYYDSLKNSPFPEVSKGARSLLESTRKRLELFDIAEHQIRELIKTKKISRTMHIHSPVRGHVVRLNALQGMYVEPGKNLYSIADISNIWVMAEIYEYEFPWVKLGQSAEMNLPYFPGRTFKGTVTYIEPFLDPKTRTLKVRMEFANPDLELKPDMYANVILKSAITKKGLAVPEEAVIHSGERTLVILAKDSGTFESREVKLGVATDGYFQVLSGLREGEKVVVSSAFLIDSESKLREALKKLEAPAKSNRPERKKPPTGKLNLKMEKENASGKQQHKTR